MIKLSQIHIQYDQLILDHEMIEIPCGKITLIKGRSGIGKTALLYRIALMSDDQQFCYEYDGRVLENNKERELFRKNQVSFVLQDIVVFSHFTVLQTIQYFGDFVQQSISENQAEEMLKQVDLDVQLNQNIMTLSLGEKQRLSIICAMIKKPSLLVLDEPTASLDQENEKQIMNILSQLSKTGIHIVLASHSEVAEEYADVIYTICDTHLIQVKKSEESSLTYDEHSLSVSNAFLKKYARHYIQYYRFIYAFLIMIFILSTVSCMIFHIFTDRAQNKNIHLLQSRFDNKLLITKDQDHQFLDQDIMPMMSSVSFENAYPLYKVQADVGGEYISVIPYFEGDKIDNDLSSNFSKSPEGVYMDRQTYQKYKNLSLDALCLYIYAQTQEYRIERTFPINGVLVDYYEQHYTTQSQTFIFMPYQTIKDIYEEVSSSQEYPAYIILYDDFETLVSQKELLQEEGYFVNDTFTDIEALMDITDYYRQIRRMIHFMIIGLTFIIDVILISHIHLQKRKENMLLRVTGLSLYELMRIDIYEYFIEMGLSFLVSIMISMIIGIMALGLSMSIFMIIGKIVFIYMVIFLVERLLLAYREFKHHTMEKVLRESEGD